ncbi:MAG: hypothetical protein K9L89_04590, partial [Kiritimatiellales bacterium]|nr:hypothetical protein [Kiritimatiellales bacterium]
ATGGFSTRSASIGAFDSGVVDTIVIVFMFLSGINFALHYRALTGQPGCYFRDPEFRSFSAVLFLAVLFITFNIWFADYGAFGRCFRDAAFTATSIMSTTGFCTADFDRWPDASRYLLVLLMFVGACAGSTSGAIKLVRVGVLLKMALREVKLFMRPQAVIQVKYNGRVVERDVLSHIVAFFIMYISTFVIAVFLMSMFTPDLESATSSVAATLGGVGPGLAAVGAAQNYAAIPLGGQGILVLCMLLGRLELYTVLILFLPSYWKR